MVGIPIFRLRQSGRDPGLHNHDLWAWVPDLRWRAIRNDGVGSDMKEAAAVARSQPRWHVVRYFLL